MNSYPLKLSIKEINKFLNIAFKTKTMILNGQPEIFIYKYS